MLKIDTAYIWLPKEETRIDENVMVLFRKKVVLEKVPKKVMVRVSADARYRLRVNGQDVCCGPCKGDRYIRYYERVDLAPYLKTGENVIAARVIRWHLDIGRSNVAVYQGMKPFFWLEEERTETGKLLGFQTDESWRALKAEGYQLLPEEENSVYIHGSENVDGANIPFGWEKPDFDDSHWLIPRVIRDWEAMHWMHNETKKERPIPLLPEVPKRFVGVKKIVESHIPVGSWNDLLTGESHSALTLKPHTLHILEIDAGVEETGYYELKFAGGRASQVQLLCAETYWKKREDNTLYHDDREDSENGFLWGYTDQYKVGGKGSEEEPEVYSPFWFKTFRFIRLEIRVGEEPLKLMDFSFRENGYPLEVKTEIQTSDEGMNRIYELCLRTLKRCMHETYEDCPFYEQLQYAMDTRAQILFTYTMAADDRMARRTFDDFHRSLRPDGMIECCFPTKRSNVIPGFACFYIYMLHDHMMYFGDKKLLRYYMPTIESILAYFDRNLMENGIVGKTGGILGQAQYWSFIDWAPEWFLGVPNAIHSGALTMESLLYLLALQKTIEIAKFIGRADLAEYYKGLEKNLKDAILRNCYSKEKQLFTDGPGYEKDFSEQTQVFAILTGLACGEQAAELLKRSSFVEGIAQCTVAMSLYRFQAYRMAGLYDASIDRMWEPWKLMLKNHMTTCQENPGEESRSECHAWGSTALYEIPSVMLGLRPIAPGYESAEIDTRMAFLDKIDGKICTPRGMVEIHAQKENGQEKVDINASGFKGKHLYVNGKDIKEKEEKYGIQGKNNKLFKCNG